MSATRSLISRVILTTLLLGPGALAQTATTPANGDQSPQASSPDPNIPTKQQEKQQKKMHKYNERASKDRVSIAKSAAKNQKARDKEVSDQQKANAASAEKDSTTPRE